MASGKGRLVRLLSGVVTKRATITAVQQFGGFKRVLGRFDERFPAGGKVQLLLPSDDMRTYTPISTREGLVLLAWGHAGSGPGSRWMALARAGDELRFVGPQKSLVLDPGPLVLVGDETSVAAAASFAVERSGQVRAVIQSDSEKDVRAAAESVGLAALDVVPRGDTAATVSAVSSALANLPDAAVALTGGAPLVIAVREGLRLAGVRNIKTKTYWIPGQAGLD